MLVWLPEGFSKLYARVGETYLEPPFGRELNFLIDYYALQGCCISLAVCEWNTGLCY